MEKPETIQKAFSAKIFGKTVESILATEFCPEVVVLSSIWCVRRREASKKMQEYYTEHGSTESPLFLQLFFSYILWYTGSDWLLERWEKFIRDKPSKLPAIPPDGKPVTDFLHNSSMVTYGERCVSLYHRRFNPNRRRENAIRGKLTEPDVLGADDGIEDEGDGGSTEESTSTLEIEAHVRQLTELQAASTVAKLREVSRTVTAGMGTKQLFQILMTVL